MITIQSIATRKGSDEINVSELGKRLGIEERTLKKCGTTTLYRFGSSETLEWACCEAARQAMESAGLNHEEIHGVYASDGTFSASYHMPGLARTIGSLLSMEGIPMISVSQGCSGGMHALQQAFYQLSYEQSTDSIGKNLLVIAGDHTSRSFSEDNKSMAALFSDGASALVVSSGRESGLYQIAKIASGSGRGDVRAAYIPNSRAITQGESDALVMNGKAVLDFASEQAFPMMLKLLGLEAFPGSDKCYLIPHQGSGIVLERLIRNNRIEPGAVYTNGIKTIGNMTGASVFFGLEDSVRRNLAGERDVILLSFGAELAVGAAYLKKVA